MIITSIVLQEKTKSPDRGSHV